MVCVQDGVPSRALDIGCNVGRVCFELATTYNDVIGVDTSESAISAANQLRKEGEAPYTLYIEGKIVKEYKAVVNPAIVSCQPSNSESFVTTGSMRRDLRMIRQCITFN